MNLEKVLPNCKRPETFINTIICPHDEVNEYDRFIIKQIMFNECLENRTN